MKLMAKLSKIVQAATTKTPYSPNTGIKMWIMALLAVIDAIIWKK